MGMHPRSSFFWCTRPIMGTTGAAAGPPRHGPHGRASASLCSAILCHFSTCWCIASVMSHVVSCSAVKRLCMYTCNPVDALWHKQLHSQAAMCVGMRPRLKCCMCCGGRRLAAGGSPAEASGLCPFRFLLPFPQTRKGPGLSSVGCGGGHTGFLGYRRCQLPHRQGQVCMVAHLPCCAAQSCAVVQLEPL